MKQLLLAFIAVLSLAQVQAQGDLQAEFDLGYAFQNQWNYEGVDRGSIGSFGMRFGMAYQHIYISDWYLEAGIYGKYNGGKRKTETLNFSANNMKLQLPFYLGYSYDMNWKFSAGVVVENNKNFKEWNSAHKYNVRVDFITKIVYELNDQFGFSLYTNWMISDIPDVYTMDSPANGTYLGVIYHFKKKEDPYELKL